MMKVFIQLKILAFLITSPVATLPLTPTAAAEAKVLQLCTDNETGRSYFSSSGADGKNATCAPLPERSPGTPGTVNQVKSFDGYADSLRLEADNGTDPAKEKGGATEKNRSSSSGQNALSSWDADEVVSKKNSADPRCVINGETKVRKGCKVDIELIRGALTDLKFSRMGRNQTNTVKWKRTLEGACRDLSVRAVTSSCE